MAAAPAGPAVSFAVTKTDGGATAARAGTLTTRHGAVETPAALVCTRGGLPRHLSVDTLRGLGPGPGAVRGCHVCGLDLLTRADQGAHIAAAGGLHGYTGLDAEVLVVDPRDPVSHGLGWKQQGAAAVRVHTALGNLKLTPERYTALLAAMRPDLFVCLASDCDGAEARHINDKKKARDRVAALTTASLALAGGSPLAGAAGALVPVHGGRDGEMRAECAAWAEEVAHGGDYGGLVVGFALAGFGLGEDPADRAGLIARAVAPLSAAKLRYLVGLEGPMQVLDAIAGGVDLFDAEYAATLSEHGYAAVWPLEPPAGGAGAGQGGAAGPEKKRRKVSEREAAERTVSPADGADGLKINLWAAAHRRSGEPLVPGCGCYTCTHHSRAYVHHLLAVGEMNAEVLLEIHNTYHYMAFFAAVRAAIAGGRFGEYWEWFRELATA